MSGLDWEKARRRELLQRENLADPRRARRRPVVAKKPTQKQLAYLRKLAHRTRSTFTSPRTRSDASREIDRLIVLSKK